MPALYRKYRPKNLTEVIGQEQVVSSLKNALDTAKISHSYIFTGPRGCGKTSVARILAHEVNNFTYELEDSYIDIVEIDAASNTGVENIRELREKALIAPSEGKYKIYIIDEVHMLSKSAFNALLKTLEEPPKHVIFILATTDLEKVPVTITSRSQVFHFRLAPPDLMFIHLKSICEKENIKISDPALKLIVRRGGGSFRDSLSLLDQISTLGDDTSEISEQTVADCLGLLLDSQIDRLLSAYATSANSDVSSLLKALFAEGVQPQSIAESLLSTIISNPDPIFLPLLEKLPAVTPPYPEAKLLLALLSNPAEQRTTSQTIRPNDAKTSPEFSNTKKDISEVTISNAPLSAALKTQLSQCVIKDSGDTVHIYPRKKITKTILSRPNNSDSLRDTFGKDFIIHELDELEKSPEVAKISDIMGNVQEVEENGGIPF